MEHTVGTVSDYDQRDRNRPINSGNRAVSKVDTALPTIGAELRRAPRLPRTGPQALLHLQRLAGNRAVAKAIASTTPDVSEHPNLAAAVEPRRCQGQPRSEQATQLVAVQRDEPAGVAPDPEHEDRCKDLLGLIKEAAAELLKRAADLQKDPLGLQWDNWTTPKITPDGTNLGSVKGHQQQYENWRTRLRNLIKKWNDDDCNSTGRRVPQDVRDLQFEPIPEPIPRPRPETDPKPWEPPGARRLSSAAKGALIGTGIGATLGAIAGAIVGGVGGAAGGTLVAPGVGTVGGAGVGGVEGATAGAWAGAGIGAAIGTGVGTIIGWITGD